MADPGVAVLVAPPGAGKTTLVPPELAAAAWCSGKVLLLEPRRLAARAAATRIAELMGSRVGGPTGLVGLRTRGDTRTSPTARIEVVTEGVLTRMVMSDPSLPGISAVIFDEFHERSLEADLGLALCLDVRALMRPDLRLLVMSATLDGAAAARLLGDAPVIESLGRAFAVDTVWCPPAPRQTWESAVVGAVHRALDEQAFGDVLVFLPGMGEIRRIGRLLGSIAADVVELHGSLRSSEQDRALAPAEPRTRRVVLATAIAQTSVTLPGVTAVVDGGLARRSRFDPRRGMGGLVTEPVSQASADQRRGRAGRVRPGVCYRVWSEHAQRALPVFDPPEIILADLTGLMLDLAAWGGLDDERWLDPPPAGAARAASRLLAEIGAIDATGRVTEYGRDLTMLGIHPRLAHMIRQGDRLGHGRLACDIAALLGERDILTGPPSSRPADLGQRLAALYSPTATTDRLVRERVRNDARRYAQRAGLPLLDSDGAGTCEAAGLLVGLAFPDRIGRRRSTASRYVLTSGAGAAIEGHDTLANNMFLSIAELDLVHGAADAIIRLGAPLDVMDIETILGEKLQWHTDTHWDRRVGDVVATRQRRFGALVVEEDQRVKPSGAAATEALLAGVGFEGLSLLDLPESIQTWRDRVAVCRRYLGDAWPDLSDTALTESLEDWLVPSLAGCFRRADLRRVDWSAVLKARLVWTQAHSLDATVPTHLTVPSGSRVAIDYSTEVPTVAVKLQEMFGLLRSPTLADGRIPLVLHLLSPARRPLQVTADLASFWATTYPALRAQMRGQYPRHPWPEDPLAASPTARTTPRR